MLDNFLGTENFRVGVRNFLRKFIYGNAVTQDLWNSLQGVIKDKVNVTRTMDTWTRQMGFPVLYVKTSTRFPVSCMHLLTFLLFIYVMENYNNYSCTHAVLSVLVASNILGEGPFG